VLESVAHTWLRFERQGWLLEKERISGCLTHVLIVKDKPHIKTAWVALDIPFGELKD